MKSTHDDVDAYFVTVFNDGDGPPSAASGDIWPTKHPLLVPENLQLSGPLFHLSQLVENLAERLRTECYHDCKHHYGQCGAQSVHGRQQ